MKSTHVIRSSVAFIIYSLKCYHDSFQRPRGVVLVYKEINLIRFLWKKMFPFTEKKSIEKSIVRWYCAIIGGSGTFSIFTWMGVRFFCRVSLCTWCCWPTHDLCSVDIICSNCEIVYKVIVDISCQSLCAWVVQILLNFSRYFRSFNFLRSKITLVFLHSL